MTTVGELAKEHGVTLRTDELNDHHCVGAVQDGNEVRFWLTDDGSWYVIGDIEEQGRNEDSRGPSDGSR